MPNLDTLQKAPEGCSMYKALLGGAAALFLSATGASAAIQLSLDATATATLSGTINMAILP